MAASVQLIEKHGVGGTATDKTLQSIRFKNADDALVDTASPMVVSGVSDFSFEKWLRLNITGGTYTQITNVRAYSDGANGLGTGVLVWAKSVASYLPPTQPTNSSGWTFFFSLLVGSPLVLGTGPYTGTGEIANHLVLMCEVQNTAVGGITPNESVFFVWDEI